MAGLNSLPVRDLVALIVIAARSMERSRSTDLNAKDVVKYAFEVADEFSRTSEGHWANMARERGGQAVRTKDNNNAGGRKN